MLLKRKIFFEIFLVQSDLMNDNSKKWFSSRKPLMNLCVDDYIKEVDLAST